MLSKKNIFPVVSLFSVFMVFVSCGKQEAKWRGTIEEIDGAKHIENPELVRHRVRLILP